MKITKDSGFWSLASCVTLLLLSSFFNVSIHLLLQKLPTKRGARRSRPAHISFTSLPHASRSFCPLPSSRRRSFSTVRAFFWLDMCGVCTIKLFEKHKNKQEKKKQILRSVGTVRVLGCCARTKGIYDGHVSWRMKPVDFVLLHWTWDDFASKVCLLPHCHVALFCRMP